MVMERQREVAQEKAHKAKEALSRGSHKLKEATKEGYRKVKHALTPEKKEVKCSDKSLNVRNVPESSRRDYLSEEETTIEDK